MAGDQRAIALAHRPIVRRCGILIGGPVVERNAIERRTIGIAGDRVEHRPPRLVLHKVGQRPVGAIQRRMRGLLPAIPRRAERPLIGRRESQVAPMLVPACGIGLDDETARTRDRAPRIATRGMQPPAAKIDRGAGERKAVRTAAEAVLRFEEEDGASGIVEVAGGSDAGGTGADDDGDHGSSAIPRCRAASRAARKFAPAMVRARNPTTIASAISMGQTSHVGRPIAPSPRA